MSDEVMKQNQELQNYSPIGLISQALAQNATIETLERLMGLQERWEARQAKKAFDEAMSLFQSKCPIIKKTKKGSKTNTGIVVFMYAPIEDIVAQTKDLIAECGFSYLIKTPTITKTDVTVTCEVRHQMGHSEIGTITMPMLTRTGVMSEAQVVSGTSTFAKRNVFCNSFGIMTQEKDNDGMVEKAEQKKETIPAPAQINRKNEIDKCTTVKQLTELWKRFTEKEQEDFKIKFTAKKEKLRPKKVDMTNPLGV